MLKISLKTVAMLGQPRSPLNNETTARKLLFWIPWGQSLGTERNGNSQVSVEKPSRLYMNIVKLSHVSLG